MSSIINLLPENISNQIAAGEVIQRPASVVKELLENSIDAKATKIKLVLKDSGKTLIKVIDDGTGMDETDARMCFERHATSKIKTTEDIFEISTKGFRGEALASIGAISQVELKTRQQDSDVGTEILMEAGVVKKQEFCQTPKGTIFSVKNLFFNTPARRKFLKSDNIEYRHILDEFFRVAIAHPDISFYLENNDNVVFNLESGSLKDRIEKLIGKRIQGNLLKIGEDSGSIEVYGFASTPKVSKKARGEQYFFVNNRFIKNYYLNHAVVSAYSGMLKESYLPSYFLFLKIDPRDIDINIHPTKTEVKFNNEAIIYSMVNSSVKYAIGKYSSNTIDFDVDPDIERELSIKSNKIYEPKIKVDKNFNPFELEKKQNANKSKDSWKILYSGIDEIIKNENIKIENNKIYQTEVSFEEETIHSEIFQYKNKYLVFFNEEGINIINQRLAHVRILYEESLKKEQKNNVSKQLLYPFEFDMSEQEKQMVLDLRAVFVDLGFDLSILKNKLVLKAVPYILKDIDMSEFLEKIFDNYSNFNDDLRKSVLEEISMISSENRAIKNGDKLSREEMLNIKKKLFSCDNYNYTPKGERIYYTITDRDIFNNIK